jgi:hypothetical protein
VSVIDAAGSSRRADKRLRHPPPAKLRAATAEAAAAYQLYKSECIIDPRKINDSEQ